MSSRYTVLKNDVCNWECEIDDNGIHYVHCTVYKWDKQVYKDYLIAFHTWCLWLKERGEEVVFAAFPKDDKIKKFSEMFGFKYVDDVHAHCLMVKEIGE